MCITHGKTTHPWQYESPHSVVLENSSPELTDDESESVDISLDL